MWRGMRRLWPPGWRSARQEPAIPIEKSVTRNVLICLETGTRHVSLRRHLAQTLGLTPAEYRRRWGLPDDYPMVSQTYLTLRKAAIFRDLPKGEQ